MSAENLPSGNSDGTPSPKKVEGNNLWDVVYKAQLEWQADQLNNGINPDVSEITAPEISKKIDMQIRQSLYDNGFEEFLDQKGNTISALSLPFDAPWVSATPEEIAQASTDLYSYIRIGWIIKIGASDEILRMADSIISGDLKEKMEKMKDLDLPED
jgi:hypothetical protein